MTDPYITLEDAHQRLAAVISDRAVGNKLAEAALLHWRKRQRAVSMLQTALCDSALAAFVRDPRSFGLFPLTAADWRGAAFAREIIIGGLVHASAGEEISRHDGWRVLVQKSTFDKWLASAKTPTTAAAVTDCLSWLMREMKNSPDAKPHPKAWYHKQANKRFDVSGRAFDRQWDGAIEKTGAAAWSRSGAPKKSKQ